MLPVLSMVFSVWETLLNFICFCDIVSCEKVFIIFQLDYFDLPTAPVFWTPRSEKIHYVHKSCNSSSYCAQQQRDVGIKCMRDWYRDWECYECCQGDRCNFYVTVSDSGYLSLSFLVLFYVYFMLLMASSVSWIIIIIPTSDCWKSTQIMSILPHYWLPMRHMQTHVLTIRICPWQDISVNSKYYPLTSRKKIFISCHPRLLSCPRCLEYFASTSEHPTLCIHLCLSSRSLQSLFTPSHCDIEYGWST